MQPSGNRILAAMSEDQLGLLQPNLEFVELPLRTPLEHRMKKIEHVYFMETGMASVVADGDRPIEIGVIGREGMTGVSLVLGQQDQVPYQTYIQVEASAQRIAADVLSSAIRSSRDLHQVLLNYVHSFLAQTTETAMANGRATLEQRLARWLLMVNDRVDGDVVPMTHDFLGIMLGVQRTGVTVTLKELERRGTISQKRGAVEIIDRETLEDLAKPAYSKPPP